MALFLFAVGCGIGYASSGCKPAEVPLPEYCYDEQKLTGALVACVKNAPTKEMWLACRTMVNASCGFVVAVTDGGVP